MNTPIPRFPGLTWVLLTGNTEDFDKSVEAYDFAIAIDESFASAYF